MSSPTFGALDPPVQPPSDPCFNPSTFKHISIHFWLMKQIRIYGTLLSLLVILIVIVQNTEIVDTRILFATVSMPRAALLGITLLIGIILGILFATFGTRSPKK